MNRSFSRWIALLLCAAVFLVFCLFWWRSGYWGMVDLYGCIFVYYLLGSVPQLRPASKLMIILGFTANMWALWPDHRLMVAVTAIATIWVLAIVLIAKEPKAKRQPIPA